MSPPIHTLTSSQGAVFLINSCQGYFSCGPDCSRQALFRSYGCFFAEFLGDLSLVRLGLLDLTTCVGLRYGFCNTNLRSFSRKRACVTSLWRTSARAIPVRLILKSGRRIFLSPPRDMPTGIQLPAHTTTLRPSIEYYRSMGILTHCPSTATFVIALGPD